MEEAVSVIADVPSDVLYLCKTLQRTGAKAWIVGGCVRDRLIGRPVNDWDIATDALPDVVRQQFRRVALTGLKHGTVTVLLHGQGYEVTTLRGEGTYSDGRHPDDVTFVRDLREDLARRDFTINAMAFDPVDGGLSDPFGGQKDLENGLIRAVGNPNERFAEDSLRLMRAARFSSSLGFSIEHNTLCAMMSQADGLHRVAVERVADELRKMLLSPKPSVGLQLLRQTNLLPIVLPELLPTIGCVQNDYHAYDVWEHTLSCVDASPSELSLRLAALLHDIAKPSVRGWSEKSNNYTFYNHEIRGAELARRTIDRLKMSAKLRERVLSLVRNHLIVYDSSWSDAAVRRWIRRVHPDLVSDQLSLAHADIVAKGTPTRVFEQLSRIEQLRQRVLLVREQGDALSMHDLAIKGGELIELLGLTPGPIVGATMRHLFELVLDDPARNERDTLLDMARDFIQTEREST